MIELTDRRVAGALKSLAKSNAKGETPVGRYLAIQRLLSLGNVAARADFQKQFNGFYRVRRDEDWRRTFFKILQKNLNKPRLVFSQILAELHQETGRIEASFASKLVASLHPHKPVIDSVVLKNIGLKLPAAGSKDRQAQVVAIYEKLETELNAVLRTPSWKQYEKTFDKAFPQASSIPALKKLDLLLWQMRK